MNPVTLPFIRYALDIGAIQFALDGLELPNGRRSPYIFDITRFTNGRALRELAAAYGRIIRTISPKPEIIYGPAGPGAIIAPAVALSSAPHLDVAWAAGTINASRDGSRDFAAGTAVRHRKVLIADVESPTNEAVEHIERSGGTVIGGILAFDRQESMYDGGPSAAQRFVDDCGRPVFAAATRDDLIAVLTEHPTYLEEYPMILQDILAYRTQYGVS